MIKPVLHVPVVVLVPAHHVVETDIYWAQHVSQAAELATMQSQAHTHVKVYLFWLYC